MNGVTQSSELQRAAEEAQRNRARLSDWELRKQRHQRRLQEFLRGAANRALVRKIAWCPRSLDTDWIDRAIEQRNDIVQQRDLLRAHPQTRIDGRRESACMAECETAARAGVRPAERAALALVDYEARCDQIQRHARAA